MTILFWIGISIGLIFAICVCVFLWASLQVGKVADEETEKLIAEMMREHDDREAAQ